MSRLSLSAPPPAIIMVIPFTYNILKKHPALMVMIHNTDVEDEYTGKLSFFREPTTYKHRCRARRTKFFMICSFFLSMLSASFTHSVTNIHVRVAILICIDPFLSAEPNPTVTRALESSLWELASHRSHYHATVSTLCKIFTEPFTKPNYPLEDFLDHTYATVCSIPFHQVYVILNDRPLWFEKHSSLRQR